MVGCGWAVSVPAIDAVIFVVGAGAVFGLQAVSRKRIKIRGNIFLSIREIIRS
jgi:hypothetical protein